MPDLIDRDKVLETVFNVMSDDKVVHKHRALNRNIKQIPKADTERHAHWIHMPYTLTRHYCSNCKGVALGEVMMNGLTTKSKFCPHCGCLMDEVVK